MFIAWFASNCKGQDPSIYTWFTVQVGCVTLYESSPSIIHLYIYNLHPPTSACHHRYPYVERYSCPPEKQRRMDLSVHDKTFSMSAILISTGCRVLLQVVLVHKNVPFFSWANMGYALLIDMTETYSAETQQIDLFTNEELLPTSIFGPQVLRPTRKT